MLVKGGTDS